MKRVKLALWVKIGHINSALVYSVGPIWSQQKGVLNQKRAEFDTLPDMVD